MTPKEQESIFQKALDNWYLTSEKKYKDVVWERVFEACKANACKLVKGYNYNPNFIDRVIQATDTCIRYIFENNKRPRSLITFCYLPTLAAIQGPKAMEEDGVRKDKDGNIIDRDLSIDSPIDTNGTNNVFLTDALADTRYDVEAEVINKEEKVISCTYKGRLREFTILRNSENSTIKLDDKDIFRYDNKAKKVIFIDDPKLKDTYLEVISI